jgi:hypothetical protein
MIFAEAEAALRTMRDENQAQYQGTRESIEKTVKLICDEKINIRVSFRDEHDGDGGRSLLMLSYKSVYDDSGLFLSCVPICTSSGISVAPICV